ncbi:glycoside hydrolase family 15 protein [Mycobacterium sp. 1274761.0]|uniref:glycoside hydrolase family 15 protein n=1 Tax=Mycobacterium sp. 1274761.0 TaxID=1834077 RepID=UPI000801EC80|nr:glycoside hydrolase family 15 protein [Mycobacterium sp. 1274761.0]OBK76770.1 glucoamylase [Mycobacterium sp. 1274761.0]
MTGIEDYALLGDLHTAALVGRDGAIDWLCLPRFDSPACFAALLGGPDAGSWCLAPVRGGQATRRRYRDDSLVLETDWVTGDGSVRIIDFMPPRGKAADVVRIVEGISGRVPMTMTLRLRFEYGHVVPWVRRRHGGLSAIAGPDAVWLRTPVDMHGEHLTTVAEFIVAEGQRIPFVLTHQLSHLPPPDPVDADKALRETEQWWGEWMSQLRYDGQWQPEVRRALLLLKALTYQPTGGILAAATTSLPEQLGGPRNWDYRYCWLRDATFTLQALLGTGFVDEARAWREWLVRAVAGDPADLQIMYGLDGRRRLPESELPWLAGYENSSPVHVGNAASAQLQLDVWGEVLDGLHLARESGLPTDEVAWDVQAALLDFLESHWDQPDYSLWEMRGPARQFVHSKVMAWAGVDRAVRTVENQHLPGPLHQWRALRSKIHHDICSNGYSTSRECFTQAYGSDDLDAALLLMPRVGFLPYTDPRIVATVKAIQEELSWGGLLLRYLPQASDDGLPGAEGAFLACTFWLVDALDGIGQREQATALFERLLDLRNDVGMLSEEYDPETGRQLGNTPQAFSLVGLINSARQLSGHHTGTSAHVREQDLYVTG